MSYEHCTTDSRKFGSHLTSIERGSIQALLAENRSVSYIAKKIGVHRATIYREIKRGTVEQKNSNLKHYTRYFGETGQIQYEQNRKRCKKSFELVKAQDFVGRVVDLVKREKFSVDAAVGRIKRIYDYEHTVCTKTSYNYIDLGLIPIKAIDLPLKVRLNTKRSKIRKNRRILVTSIEDRPDVSNEFGHWEIDTMVGSRTKGEALVTIDEKQTRMRFIVRIKAKTAAAVTEALGLLMDSFGHLKEQVFKSITADNGSEFATLQRAFPEVPMYYCHPYSSFE